MHITSTIERCFGGVLAVRWVLAVFGACSVLEGHDILEGVLAVWV